MTIHSKAAIEICRKYFDCFKDHLKGEIEIEFVDSDYEECQFVVTHDGEAHDVTLQIKQQEQPNQYEVSVGCTTHFSSVECMPVTGMEENFGAGENAIDAAYDDMGPGETFCWPITITLYEPIEPTVYDQVKELLEDPQMANMAMRWYLTRVILSQKADPVQFLLNLILDKKLESVVNEYAVANFVDSYLNKRIDLEESIPFTSVDEFITIIQK